MSDICIDMKSDVIPHFKKWSIKHYTSYTYKVKVGRPVYLLIKMGYVSVLQEKFKIATTGRRHFLKPLAIPTKSQG